MRDRRVVLTGMGVIAPTGFGIDSLWRALVDGRSSISRIDDFDVASCPSQIAGRCSFFDPTDYLSASRARRLGRFCQLGIACAQLAIADAGLTSAASLGTGTGIFIGTACGATHIIEEQFAVFLEKGYRRVHPMLAPMASPQAAASQIAAELKAKGPILTVSSDCPAGIDAIGWAAREIAAGNLSSALAGGVDTPITPLLLVAFNRSGALSVQNDMPERACRPFDKERNGFVLSEGAAIFFLETLDAAVHRNARIYGEVTALGWATEASSEFGRSMGTDGIACAMTNALRSAARPVEAVSFICAHAPAIPATDLAEARAIASIFGTSTRRPPVTSIKGAVGQPLAAGSALQVAVALSAMSRRAVPPTVNCVDLDAECSIDVVQTFPRETPPGVALINSHGFGGNNSTLVLEPVEM
jgi:3-oxoacyl-[acyl-carrier-protein] synthase II